MNVCRIHIESLGNLATLASLGHLGNFVSVGWDILGTFASLKNLGKFSSLGNLGAFASSTRILEGWVCCCQTKWSPLSTAIPEFLVLCNL